jgi:hypothetical protein
MKMKVWFRGLPRMVDRPVEEDPGGWERDREELLTYEWAWADGILRFRKRAHPYLLFSRRQQRASLLRLEVEAEMRTLGSIRWDALEDAMWFARRRKRVNIERDRRLFNPAWFVWQRYDNAAYYHARIKADPEWRDRLWRQSRERYAKMKQDPVKYSRKLAYHRNYAKVTGLRKRQHAATMADPVKRAKKNADMRAWRARKKAEQLAQQRRDEPEAAE